MTLKDLSDFSTKEDAIAALFNHLINLKDDSGQFTFETDARKVDDKSWNSWNWPQGVALYGLFRYYELSHKPEVLDAIDQWYDVNLKQPIPASDLNVNGMIPTLTLATLFDHFDTRISNLADYLTQWAEWAIHSLHRTDYRGFEHDTFGNFNDQQLWDDTLMMAVLPLAKIGVVLDRPDYVQEAMQQILVHSKFLMDSETGLWYHSWNFSSSPHSAKVYWGRGNAWITIAIPELIAILGQQMPDAIKNYAVSVLKGQINALLPLQAESGMWRTVLDDPTAYEETSATAGFTYGFKRAKQLGLIQGATVDRAITRGQQALLNQVSPSGHLANVSSGTPVGPDNAFYKQIPVTDMPYGQALAILALAI
ncbi:glycoside hydrolase family 88/105 protein [Lacticaseibacillus hegangensis]|uniref:Glycoside hydrolase family 105 protein n=2 Tax=Lacticaseibacillus TaxID=2759736 RepID=A0ABW4CUN1_9LACO|nr:glycoside hydrolase family 88 protein [Lacticaseibacillus hegangensis]